MFPASRLRLPALWLSDPPPFIIHGTPLDRSVVEHFREVVTNAADRYPEGLLERDIESVSVYKTVSVDLQSFGGFYANSHVFIAALSHPVPGVTQDDHVAQTLHHEVSSVLLRKHRRHFDAARFRAGNPPGFQYEDERPGAKPLERMYTAADSTPNFQALHDGFVMPYGRHNIEQDFNSYAEFLLWKPEFLLELFAADSAVGRKARVVRDFYIGVDPRFEKLLAIQAGP